MMNINNTCYLKLFLTPEAVTAELSQREQLLQEGRSMKPIPLGTVRVLTCRDEHDNGRLR